MASIFKKYNSVVHFVAVNFYYVNNIILKFDFLNSIIDLCFKISIFIYARLLVWLKKEREKRYLAYNYKSRTEEAHSVGRESIFSRLLH